MLGKPFLPAGYAAEGRPPVLGFRHLNEGSALPARKAPLYDDGLNVLGMLPVQALTMGRAELRPLVRRLRHPHETPAFQTAEGPQRLLFP